MLADLILSLSVTSWLAVAAVIALTSYFFLRDTHANLPPSPGPALPIIGHLYLMKKNPRQLFVKWRKEVGDIMTLQLGAATVVVLSGYDVLKEALVKQADYFSERPDKGLINHIPDGKMGVLFSSGPLWKEGRSVSISILRDFGMGKSVLAEKITEEVSAYTDELAKHKGKPCKIGVLTDAAVSNSICSIVFGKRFQYDDARFLRMLRLFHNITRLAAGAVYTNYFPFLRKLPMDIGKANVYIDCQRQVREFCQGFIEDCKRKQDSSSKTSFIAAYLEEIEKKKEKGQQTYLDEANLVRTVSNLFAAGTETTSTTLRWMVLYCINHPHVQKKIYEEIVEKIGVSRRPNILDKPKLKYLNAATMECMRLASIAPFALQHMCHETVTLRGFTIPKGTIIFPSLDSVLRDEKIWGDPLVFRPERFLDSEGNLNKMEEFVPFSLGRRACLGESMARMSLFLYLSTMFQRFEFLPVDPLKPLPMTESFGLTVSPEDNVIRCVERNAGKANGVI